MLIQENIILAPFTSFHIGGPSRYFCVAKNVEELQKALGFAKKNKLKILILGGGSNILISDKGFYGLAIKINFKGIKVVKEANTYVTLNIGAGQSWDKLVALAVKKKLWGIENLSHIPGTLGGFPVQNVGAYGQEASQIIQSVELMEIATGSRKVLNNKALKFGYRSSVLNKIYKNKFVVVSVTIKLLKKPKPNLKYGDLKNYFKGEAQNKIQILDIRRAVIKIRNKKFPFPKEKVNGNAGSFFNGPILSKQQFILLEKKLSKVLTKQDNLRFKTMVDRLRVPQGFKTPVGFLIEACGFKGFKVGGAMINPTQSSIILNHSGKATAKDVIALYNKVCDVVFKKTGVRLGHEPEFIGFK